MTCFCIKSSWIQHCIVFVVSWEPDLYYLINDHMFYSRCCSHLLLLVLHAREMTTTSATWIPGLFLSPPIHLLFRLLFIDSLDWFSSFCCSSTVTHSHSALFSCCYSLSFFCVHIIASCLTEKFMPRLMMTHHPARNWGGCPIHGRCRSERMSVSCVKCLHVFSSWTCCFARIRRGLVCFKQITRSLQRFILFWFAVDPQHLLERDSLSLYQNLKRDLPSLLSSPPTSSRISNSSLRLRRKQSEGNLCLRFERTFTLSVFFSTDFDPLSSLSFESCLKVSWPFLSTGYFLLWRRETNTNQCPLLPPSLLKTDACVSHW